MRDLQRTVAEKAIRSTENARKTLMAGFTTVRDAAGTPRGIKLAIEQGLFPGPRMRIAVSALSQTGGHGDSTMPNGANIRPTNSEMPHTVVDGIERIRLPLAA